MAKKGGCKGGGCKGGGRKGSKGGCKGFALTSLLVWVAAILGLTLLFGGNSGCQQPDAHVKMVVDELRPVVQKGIAELSARSGGGSVGIQGVEPGYSGDIEALWVTGVKAHWSVYLKGVSGQANAFMQADQGPDLKKPEPAPETKSP